MYTLWILFRITFQCFVQLWQAQPGKDILWRNGEANINNLLYSRVNDHVILSRRDSINFGLVVLSYQ